MNYKYLILFLFFISCSKDKEQPVPCVICTETVNYNNSQHFHQVYIKSENEYCNGEEKNVVQGTTTGSGTSNGISFTETITMSCK
jgi:hypothetical protein